MTISDTPIHADTELIRSVSRDLLLATEALDDNDYISHHAAATWITRAAPGVETWKVTAIAAGLVRKIAGRNSVDDPTDDPSQAAHLLRQARLSTNHGLFERNIPFADARVMLAVIDMAEAIDTEGYWRAVDLAQKWETRGQILDVWRLQHVAVQLVWLVAQFSGDRIGMLEALKRDLR